MKKIICLFVLLCASSFAHAAGFLVQKGKFIQRDAFATMSLQQHAEIAMEAFKKGDMKKAIHHFSIVSSCFPDTPEAVEAHYYAALAFLKRREYDFANEKFTEYLKAAPHSPRFMEVIEAKFVIADAFRHGARRRLFQQRAMPKWKRDPGLAVQIFDEIIAALPNHQKTILSLYYKGMLLNEMLEFRESIDSFQTLIRRFPKSEYTPLSFLQILEVYSHQSEYEMQNSDIITFAEMELEKFRHMFPRDERLLQAQKKIIAIKESYAEGLYEIGQFYERKKNPEASILYYRTALAQFPETMVAKKCQERLLELSEFISA